MRILDHDTKTVWATVDCAFAQVAVLRFAGARNNEITDGHYILRVQAAGETHEFHLLVTAGIASCGRFRKSTTQARGQLGATQLQAMWRQPITETFDAGAIVIA